MEAGNCRIKVRCKPDIDVADLVELIKEKFTMQDCASLHLKFKDRVLHPEESIDVILDEKDSNGKHVPVIV